MDTFGQRLREARIKKKLTQLELGSLIGAKPAAVSSWEVDNSKPDILLVSKMCEVLNTTPSHLIDGKADKDFTATPDEQSHIQKYRGCDQRGRDMVDTVLDYEFNRTTNPVTEESGEAYIGVRVHFQAAAAGLNNYLTEDGYEEVMFPAASVPRGTDYGVRISGDSMEPDIPDGCIVFVKTKPAIESGKVGIFCLNGDGLCKRLEVDHDRRVIRLISDNEKYKPKKIRPDDDLRTYGEVLGWIMQ